MTKSKSSIAQVADWLTDNVGEGCTFTKHDLRAALPQFEQVDRRMRDLRSFDWQIDTYREDARLSPGELKLVRIGLRPDDPSTPSIRGRSISAKERLAAFSSADFSCQACGASLGEKDESDSGHVSLRAVPTAQGLFVACDLCARNAPHQFSGDISVLERQLSRLSRDEVDEVADRIRTENFQTQVESAVALASRLPRTVVLQKLQEALATSQTPSPAPPGRGDLLEVDEPS